MGKLNDVCLFQVHFMKFIHSVLLLILFLTALSVTAFSQTTGSIAGQVTDSLGAIVPGTTVTAVSADGKQKQAVTNSLEVRKPIYEALKDRKILVRYMNYAGDGDGLRISVGTDADAGRLMDELRTIL